LRDKNLQWSHIILTRLKKTASFLNIASITEAWFLRVFHFNNNKKGVPFEKKNDNNNVMKKKPLSNFVEKPKPLSFIFSLHFKNLRQCLSTKLFSL